MPPFSADTALNPFTEEEEMYRHSLRSFLDRELEPYTQKFIDNLDYDKAFFRKAGAAGLLGAIVPEEYGGPGASSICGVVMAQELGRSIGGTIVGGSLSVDILTELLLKGGSEALKRRWLPQLLSGEITQCMPLTEADAGSDMLAMRSTAVRKGNDYVINGSKLYVTNGNKADLLYVVVKTDLDQRGKGISMILVEAETPGITRKCMRTMGYPAYDLAEFHFNDVRVPAANLLAAEGRGMELVMALFARDRLEIGARALGEAELAFQLALDYAKVRKAFGKPILEFQNTQFKLAEMKTEIEIGRSFLHDAVRKCRANSFQFVDGAMVKLWIPEMADRVIDKAMQMFGGAGFMDEMPISWLYRANRLHMLYAGTSELQKVAIAKTL